MYDEILVRFAESFKKLAADLVAILNNPIFQVGENDRGGYGSIVSMREQVFHDFCALCAQAELPVPEMEKSLITAQQPRVEGDTSTKHAARTKRIQGVALPLLKGNRSKKAMKIRTLIKSFEFMPSLSGSYPGAVSAKEMECLINGLLIEMGLPPVRPDYKAREVNSASGHPAPKRIVKVLVVDDGTSEIFRTMRALAGWENLNVSAYHYEPKGDRWSATGEVKGVEYKRVAGEILALSPDVVLMDQGLNLLEGHELVRQIQSQVMASGATDIVFVANTGGSDDSLRSVGAFENCNKGERLLGVSRALMAVS